MGSSRAVAALCARAAERSRGAEPGAWVWGVLAAEVREASGFLESEEEEEVVEEEE
jgi:hypothetical protein